MSLYYLSVAEQLLAQVQTIPVQDVPSNIELAIASLELFLAQAPSSISVENDVYARLTLANTLYAYTDQYLQIESILSRATIRLGNQEQYISQRMMINDLLTRAFCETGSFNAARQIIKDSITLCNDRGKHMDPWLYTFLIRSFEVEPGITPIRALWKTAEARCNEHMMKVAEILEFIHCLNSNVESKYHNMRDISYPSSLLDIVYLALSVMLDTVAGNITSTSEASTNALKKLTAMHKFLDRKEDSSTEIVIPVPLNEEGTITASVTLKSFSSLRMFIFMYLLSGVLHLPDMTSTRCEKFLAEGLKQLKVETAGGSSVCKWSRAMQANLHFYSCINAILRVRPTDVESHLKVLADLAWDIEALCYLRGCYYQMVGRLEEAVNCYLSVHRAELQPYSMLNLALIYRGSVISDADRANEILQYLRPLCIAGQLRTAYRFVESVESGATTVVVKRILTEVLNISKLHANSQFSMLALSVLSVRSSDPDDMRFKFASYASSQASRSATGGTTPVGEMRPNIWALFHARTLEAGFNIRGEHEKAQKTREMCRQTEQGLGASMPAVSAVLSGYE